MSWMCHAASVLQTTPAADYDDPLTTQRDDSLSRLTWQLLIGLTVLAVILRLASLYDDAPPVRDAFYYSAVAQSLVDGNLFDAFEYLNLNLFTAILGAAQACGIDPLAAGTAIGIVSAGLTVPLLFGWVRRMYDDQVALAACLLFALHPRLVRLSVEPLRESLFYLMFVAALYCFWRAAAEQKWRYFLLAGVAMTLAIHTRSEGWLLLVPAIGWPLGRWWVDRGSWRVSLGGLTTAFLVLPACLLLVNCTLLAGHPRCEWGRLAPLQLVFGWQRTVDAPPTETALAATPSSSKTNRSEPNLETRDDLEGRSALANVPTAPTAIHVSAVSGTSTERAEQALKARAKHDIASDRRPLQVLFINDLSAALNPLIALLMLAALIRWRHLVIRRDKLVLAAMALAIAAAVVLRQERFGQINGRYFFAVFFIGAGCAGQGLLLVATAIFRRLKIGEQAKVAIAGGLIGCCGVAGLAWITMRDDPHGFAEQRLGHLIAASLPDDSSLAATHTAARVAMYAQPGRSLTLPHSISFAKRVDESGIDTVLVETYFSARGKTNLLLAELLQRGYRVVGLPRSEVSAKYLMLSRDAAFEATDASRVAARLDEPTSPDTTRR
ncbi:ArnT family glycosyltransferase [Stratiformator vulcanicus]|uniref:Dolichyl-phosphate-mannose-protein mannosyltransferase n=1 Tax=Stratiformator vulcanicus TaxID=2527980 RepID=A0A517QXP9_9PLAN|nr:glycosyltransferase family 39 protein [Stratiformator vulcanicus]QDT36377.1 Dolichyl-phosphate-mannose-protein mannosyltransferase [Stratiformator vulcanicus]